MNDRTPIPPTDHDADRAFAAYFQHQLPAPWPTFRGESVTVPAASRAARGGTHSHPGRLTLGVSAAVLLGLGLALTGGPRPARPDSSAIDPSSGLMGSATADGRHVQPPAPRTSVDRPVP